jgi:hypothetical protein
MSDVKPWFTEKHDWDRLKELYERARKLDPDDYLYDPSMLTDFLESKAIEQEKKAAAAAAAAAAAKKKRMALAAAKKKRERQEQEESERQAKIRQELEAIRLQQKQLLEKGGEDIDEDLFNQLNAN